MLRVVPGNPDQSLVINGDIVLCVDVVLQMVDLGEEEHVDGSHRQGNGALGVGVRRYHIASSAIPILVQVT